jgi:hypothetical protein
MKIESIEDILNFRFNKAFLRPTWWEQDGSSENFTEFNDIDFLEHHPLAYDHFKIIIDSSRTRFINNSRSNDVFCDTQSLRILPSILKFKKRNFNNLVCAGDDTLLSQAMPILESVRSYFNQIFFEGKNINCDWVKIIPMGMIMAYMIRNGGNDNILPQINKDKKKTKLIAAAFGSRWPELLDKIPDRQSLHRLLNPHRRTIRRLRFQNEYEKLHCIKDISCDPKEFYEKLCDYKFFASPLGNGIQTPKICECIMCETVPVVTNHVAHVELKNRYDLPLLIVDQWSDITADFLNEQWEQTYSKVKWSRQKSKFLIKNFKKLLK